MRNDNVNFPLAPKDPSIIPSGNLPANQPLGDIVIEGVTQNSFQGVTKPEGEALPTVSVPEGVANNGNILEALDEEVERLIESTGNPLSILELSETGRPRRNVGNYRQGPAKIRRLPIEGEQYDFSFSVFSDWERPMSVSANRSNIQANYHPQQRVNKSFLAECYLLQDLWFGNPTCLYHLSTNIVIDTWEMDEIYISEDQL